MHLQVGISTMEKHAEWGEGQIDVIYTYSICSTEHTVKGRTCATDSALFISGTRATTHGFAPQWGFDARLASQASCAMRATTFPMLLPLSICATASGMALTPRKLSDSSTSAVISPAARSW